MRFLYGLHHHNIDITEKVLSEYTSEELVRIPSNDVQRAHMFTDPMVNVKKIIIAIDDNGNEKCFKAEEDLVVNLTDHFEEKQSVKESIHKIRDSIQKSDNPKQTLTSLQNALTIEGGDFTEEYPEQLMSASFISKHSKVLEIGSNIGRNSLIIASLLNDDTNFVTLECDPKSYDLLVNNRNLNEFKFHCENSALSKKKLIQRGWTTIPSNYVLEGFKPVNTINYVQLKEKYNIEFDTLVIDCEGAFYHILKDMPEILDTVKLVLIENDFTDESQKDYVDEVFRKEGFSRVQNFGTVPAFPQYSGRFYEVWAK